MKRRQFFKHAVAGTAAAGSAIAMPAYAQGRRQLKMVTTWPKNFPGLGTGAARVAKRITEATEGALTVKLYAAGELVPAFSAFDAVSSGTADMYHAGEYYWQGKSPAFNFFSAVPMGLLAGEHFAWVHFGGGQELWDELSAQYNIRPFMAGSTGPQMGGWFKAEINTLEDLKGLNFRIPGLGGEVMRRLGVNSVTLPGGDIFPSLQSGAIDGTEWVGPWNDLAFGFHKVAQYYYYPGVHEPGSVLALGINLDLWNSLTAGQQAIVRAVADAENDTMLAEYNAHNAAALKTLVDKHGVQLRRFSDDILKEFGRLSGVVLAEAAESDALTKRVYESFRKFYPEARRWTGISTEAFAQARGLDYTYLQKS